MLQKIIRRWIIGCIKFNEYVDAKEKMRFFGKENRFDEQELNTMISNAVKEAIKELPVLENKPTKWWEKYGVTIVACIITAVLSVIGATTLNYHLVKVDLEVLKTLNSSFAAEMSSMNTELQSMHNYLYNNNGVEDQLELIMATLEELNVKVINVTEEDAMSALENISVVDNDISHTAFGLTSDMTLGVDSNGNVYMVDELIGETILLTYQDEGKDVFFLGQYSDELRWDGYCVTNAFYPDGTLYSICETNFDNGRRLDYKTIVRNGNKESSAWGYYCRTCNEQVNTGVSIEYVFDYFDVKNFTSTNVRRTDIRYVDDFVEIQEKIILKYYYGNTKDGLFHDDTGNAVYVKLDTDGTVRSVYKGCFSKGYFDDTTGNAWNLVYWDKKGYYVCNLGDFKNGVAVVFSPERVEPETKQEEIDKMDIPFKLKWKMDE